MSEPRGIPAGLEPKLTKAISEFFARTYDGESEADVLIDIIADAILADRAELDRLREENRASKVLLESKDETIRQLTEERADQWRQRRDAEGSRDAARAAADSLRIERDALREAMEGIVHFSDALNFREDHLSKALRQWIDEGRKCIAKAEGE